LPGPSEVRVFPFLLLSNKNSPIGFSP
jgi:hypothetical protein